MRELWAWYAAPWRRMGRAEFGVVILVLSLPGLLLSIMGIGDGLAGWLGPVQSLLNHGAGAAPAGADAALQALWPVPGALSATGASGAESATGAALAPATFDGVGMLNNGLMVLAIPLCRMRVLDMGYTLRTAWWIVLVVNVANVNGMVQALGVDVLPWGMLWSVVNFVGLLWLCMAKGGERLPVHMRTDYAQPLPPVDEERL